MCRTARDMEAREGENSVIFLRPFWKAQSTVDTLRDASLRARTVFRFNSLWEEAGPETELPRARGPWVIAGNRPQAAPRRL